MVYVILCLLLVCSVASTLVIQVPEGENNEPLAQILIKQTTYKEDSKFKRTANETRIKRNAAAFCLHFF